MTVDLLRTRWTGPRLGVAPLCTFCPQRRVRYILMPESPVGHNNTIGLTGFSEPSGGCQTSAILRLTPP